MNNDFNPPRLMKSVMKQIAMDMRIINKGKHGITIDSYYPQSDYYRKLVAVIPGPNNSPYEDGQFKIKIFIGPSYPFRPPVLKFITPMFHPNIEEDGKICLDLLRKSPGGEYESAYRLEGILVSVQLLLAYPNLEDPVNTDAAALFKTNLNQYNEKIRELVKLHCPKVQRAPTPPELQMDWES